MQEKYFYTLVYLLFVIGLSIVIEWVCNKENFVNTNSLDSILEQVLSETKDKIKNDFLNNLKGYTDKEYSLFLSKNKEYEPKININELKGYSHEEYVNVNAYNNVKNDSFTEKFSKMKIPKLMY